MALRSCPKQLSLASDHNSTRVTPGTEIINPPIPQIWLSLECGQRATQLLLSEADQAGAGNRKHSRSTHTCKLKETQNLSPTESLYS
jgi:hypothetical protein